MCYLVPLNTTGRMHPNHSLDVELAQRAIDVSIAAPSVDGGVVEKQRRNPFLGVPLVESTDLITAKLSRQFAFGFPQKPQKGNPQKDTTHSPRLARISQFYLGRQRCRSSSRWPPQEKRGGADFSPHTEILWSYVPPTPNTRLFASFCYTKVRTWSTGAYSKISGCTSVILEPEYVPRPPCHAGYAHLG